EVFADRLRELGRRAADRVYADLVQPLDERRVLAAGGDFARDALDHRPRRGGWRDIAVPGEGAEAGIALLGDRRHLRELRRAALAGDREHLDAAAAGVRNDLVQVAEVAGHVAGDDVGHGRAAALVEHGFHLQARAREEQRHRQVADRARARRGEAELAGPLLRIGNELGERLRRQL